MRVFRSPNVIVELLGLEVAFMEVDGISSKNSLLSPLKFALSSLLEVRAVGSHSLLSSLCKLYRSSPY